MGPEMMILPSVKHGTEAQCALFIDDRIEQIPVKNLGVQYLFPA